MFVCWAYYITELIPMKLIEGDFEKSIIMALKKRQTVMDHIPLKLKSPQSQTCRLRASQIARCSILLKSGKSHVLQSVGAKHSNNIENLDHSFYTNT